MAQPIKDKVVFITGASSGLGKAAAIHLAAAGAKVVLAARREDRLETIEKEIQAAGGNCLPIKLDVTKLSDFQQAVEQTIKKYQRIDAIVNNAGYMAIAPLVQARTAEWDQMIDINIKGVLYGIAATLPIFQKQGNGHFINISSVAGTKVFSPGGTVYSGTKFAVRAISEGLRHELAGSNIRVTCIEPGAVESELKFGSEDETSRGLVFEFYKNAIPADSVSRAIVYAMVQPPEVGINEIVLRPTYQEF